MLDAMDGGRWVILNLDKGRLGEQASTLAASCSQNSRTRCLPAGAGSFLPSTAMKFRTWWPTMAGLDTLLSEARKFRISVVTANQFLEQYPAQMRAAIMAVGTHVFFQLSSTDADKIASALDGGKTSGRDP